MKAVRADPTHQVQIQLVELVKEDCSRGQIFRISRPKKQRLKQATNDQFSQKSQRWKNKRRRALWTCF
jgi:hypothetical protein